MSIESTVRAAVTKILADPRFTKPSLERLGNAYERINDNLGIGFSFPHDRTVRGKVRHDANEANWFLSLTTNYRNPCGLFGSITNRIETRMTSEDSETAYADLMSVIEQISGTMAGNDSRMRATSAMGGGQNGTGLVPANIVRVSFKADDAEAWYDMPKAHYYSVCPDGSCGFVVLSDFDVNLLVESPEKSYY